jgi:hypothetical protein
MDDFIQPMNFNGQDVGLSPSTDAFFNRPNFNPSPYMTLAGGGLSAASMFNAGNQTSALLRANATIAGLQARGEQEAGAGQAELYRQHLQARLGTQAAAIGGANVTTSGSALRSLESTAYLGAQDIARIRTNAARKAWGFDTSQAGDLIRAQQASAAGRSNAFGSLITSGARAYGSWSAD